MISLIHSKGKSLSCGLHTAYQFILSYFVMLERIFIIMCFGRYLRNIERKKTRIPTLYLFFTKRKKERERERKKETPTRATIDNEVFHLFVINRQTKHLLKDI